MRKKPVNPVVGIRLAEIRTARGLSQSQLANKARISQRMLQNYEHGRVAVTTDRIAQLARALDCEPAALLQSPGTAVPRARRRTVGVTFNAGSMLMKSPIARQPNTYVDLMAVGRDLGTAMNILRKVSSTA